MLWTTKERAELVELTRFDGHQHYPGYCSGVEVFDDSTEAASRETAACIQRGV